MSEHAVDSSSSSSASALMAGKEEEEEQQGGSRHGNGSVALLPVAQEEGVAGRSAGKARGCGKAAASAGLFPSMSAEEIRDLQVMFEAFDKNKDGHLSSDELCGWMRRLGLQISSQSLLQIIDSPDGSVNFAQFLSLYQSLQEEKEADNNNNNNNNDNNDGDGDENAIEKGEEEEEGNLVAKKEKEENRGKKKSGVATEKKSDMVQAFALFDKNGDGLISPNELGETLNDLGLLEHGKVYHWDSMVRRVDKDGDGKVNLTEFQTMMTKK